MVFQLTIDNKPSGAPEAFNSGAALGGLFFLPSTVEKCHKN
jgi:hypothetical protein